MSYNHALPVQFTSVFQERTKHARAFLDHPMTNIWDTRCVLALELLEVREPLFRPFQSVPPTGAELDDLLRQANQGIMERYEWWLEYYRACQPLLPSFPSILPFVLFSSSSFISFSPC